MWYRKNVGPVERWARFALGAVMVLYGACVLGATLLGAVLVIGGIMAAGTGVVGYCPACAMVGRRLPDSR